MPASLETKIAKAEAVLAAGLATPNQRNDYALGMVDHTIAMHIRTALFCTEDDPAAAIRSAYYAELKNWRRYPIAYAPKGTPGESVVAERRTYTLRDDGTIEARVVAMIRDHHGRYSKHTRDSAQPYVRPHFTDHDTGERVPVFRHDDEDIVKAYFHDTAVCGECDESDRVPCAPYVLLTPDEADTFGMDWQAVVDTAA